MFQDSCNLFQIVVNLPETVKEVVFMASNFKIEALLVGKRQSAEYTNQKTGEVTRWRELHVVYSDPMEFNQRTGEGGEGQTVEVLPVPSGVDFATVKTNALYDLIFQLRQTKDGRKAVFTGLEYKTNVS